MDERSKKLGREELRPAMDVPHGESVDRDDETPLPGNPSLLETSVSTVITRSFPDRRLLVLLALERNGRAHLLDEEERNALELAKPNLEAALQSSAALNDVLTRIGDEAAEFERDWTAAGADLPLRSTRQAIRRDRPALPRQARPAFRQYAYAAAVVAAVALTVLLIGDRTPSTVVIVGGEEMKEVDLMDGSSVRLAAGSTLSYRRPADQEAFDRKVRLDGSAYFIVAPDAGRPFEVLTSEARATVLGTRFAMVRREGGTEVVLASGAVTVASISTPEQVVTLSPGMMSRVSAGQPASNPVPVDVVEALEWTGLFVFRAETYGRIADHLSRHYGVPITVAPEIAAERQTGTFDRSLGLVEILATMERSWGFSVQGNVSSGFDLRPVP